MKKDTMIIGKILGAHGIRGELKVYPLTNDPGRFYELDNVCLVKGEQKKNYAVELVRLHKGNVLLTLQGVDDRNAAEKCIGQQIAIDRDEAVNLQEDEYFIEDLVGMTVVTPEEETIGTVTAIIQSSGSVDTVEIKTAEKNVYVPARKVYFLKVDTAKSKITADIPEELMAL